MQLLQLHFKYKDVAGILKIERNNIQRKFFTETKERRTKTKDQNLIKFMAKNIKKNEILKLFKKWPL